MIGIEQLKNSGIEYLGNKDQIFSDKKTIIVVGVARGGTSLVAGTLFHLGLFTGDLSREPIFEDVKLAELLEKKEFIKAKIIAENYSKEHNIWAFKRPSIINYLSEADRIFDNPIYLFVFKDIFSIANRNKISVKQEISQGLNNALNDYGKILDFIEKNNVNGLLLSYEKIMSNKNTFVELLAKIVGNDVSTENKQKALSFIEPNPSQYLDVSRTNRTRGFIEKRENGLLVGWAKYLYNDKVAKVELYINGTLYDSVDAKLYREDLLKQNISSHGNIGFKFDISEYDIKQQDDIKVKVMDDVKFLPFKQATWFNQHQFNSMLLDNYQKPDFLRDIATLLLNKGDIENADLVISKALELRPKGPAIAALKNTIMEISKEDKEC